MDPLKLRNRRYYLERILTESEKKCIREQCTKEYLRNTSTDTELGSLNKNTVNMPELTPEKIVKIEPISEPWTKKDNHELYKCFVLAENKVKPNIRVYMKSGEEETQLLYQI